MKKRILFLALILLSALQVQAVLKEKDLRRTIGVLKLELRNNHYKQRALMERMETQQAMQHARLLDYMQRSEQISLMLYSQKQDFTFDIAYACQQATDLYRELQSTNLPYDEIKKNIITEVARYDSLIFALQQLPPAIGGKKSVLLTDSVLMQKDDSLQKLSGADPNDELFILTEAEQKDRETCIMHAKSLRNNLIRILNSIKSDKQYYDEVNDKVSKLHNYAQHRYNMLQEYIFKKGGSNYFTIIASLPRQWMRITTDFADKYSILKKGDKQFSQWRGPRVIFVSFAMIFYLIIAALLSNIILRWVVPARFRTENYKLKRPAYIMSLGIILFSLAMIMLRNIFRENGPLQMSTGLMLSMSWLMGIILVSLLIRLKGEQIKYGVRMYEPFMAMAFLVILFRIILIPNTIINLIFPPILLLFTIWQIIVAKKTRRHVPMSDKIYNSISLATIIMSLIISWAGYTLLAVQITIWWTFQLSAIQTVTCLYDLMEMYERKYLLARIKKDQKNSGKSDEKLLEKMHKGDFVTKTWIYDLVNRALVPIFGVLSILFSIAFAADTFEMRGVCKDIFFNNFIDQKDVLQISLFKLVWVIALFFVFRYLNYTIRSFYFNYKTVSEQLKMEEEKEKKRIKAEAGDSFDEEEETDEEDNKVVINRTLAKNIVAIIVWGSYFIFVLVLLKVPKTGIEIVTAGLATGMGFAMKDLLENFFYGLSLMTGRIRVGDYIECDGISGKVESITYQSTQIEALDGSIIAFLNSSLFSKNFKNLTRNHEYELIKIPVGVAYGTDINKVRELILEGLAPLATKTPDNRFIVDPKKGINVVFSDFGASSVDLLVTQWLLVDQKIAYQAKAKETIYNILNDNKIEIPFPQQDVYIRRITEENNLIKEGK